MSSAGDNIYAQADFLNQLDQDIEKAIQELDSLNTNTIKQAKIIHQKIANNNLVDQQQSSNMNMRGSSSDPLADSLEGPGFQRTPKGNNREPVLRLSPTDLIPRGDPLKEFGYSVDQEELQAPFKMNSVGQNNFSNRPNNVKAAAPQPKPRDTKANRSQDNMDGYWSPTKKKNVPDSGVYQKECMRDNAISCPPARELLVQQCNQVRRSQVAMLKYHKLSNIDLPREIIHGNAKPEHFFGFQQNMRRLSATPGGKSASPNKGMNVIDRLLMYGQQKEQRRKAKAAGQDIDGKKRTLSTNTSKVKLGGLAGESDNEDEDGNKTGRRGSKAGKGNANNQLGESPTKSSQETASRSDGRGNKGDPNDPNRRGSQGVINLQGSENENQGDSFHGSFSGVPGRRPSQAALFGPGGNNSQRGDGSQRPGGNYDDQLNPPFRPQLSRKSLEMAAKLGDSFARLVDGGMNKNNENKKRLLKEARHEMTFKPKINKNANRLDEKFKANQFGGDDLHRWDQLYLMREKYGMDKEAKKQERQAQELNNPENTFKPKINAKSRQMYRDTGKTIADRTEKQLEKREMKLQREREQRYEKEVEECTFHPTTFVNMSKLGTSYSALNLNDISVASVKGLDAYFEKVDRANRIKQETEARQQKYQGKNWTRKITVPKEFHLHNRLPPGACQGNDSRANLLDISTEERIQKNVVFTDTGRNASPRTNRMDNSYQNYNNNSWVGNNYDYTNDYDNFGNAVIKLHKQLQKMDF